MEEKIIYKGVDCTMNYQLPIIAKYCINEITVEVCHGEIPDVFRQLRFGPITEFELPDTKVTDKEFRCWLDSYRRANLSGINAWFEHMLLEESQCN